MINFTSKRKWFFILSAIPLIVGIVFMVAGGIPWGIDFTGGTTMTLHSVDQTDLKTRLDGLGYTDAVVQVTGQDTFSTQTKALTADQQKVIQDSLAMWGVTATFTTTAENTVVDMVGKAAISQSAIRAKLDDMKHGEATIQKLTDSEGVKFSVETKEIEPAERAQLQSAFGQNGWLVSGLDSVSGTVSKEKARGAAIGVALASLGMLLYIWWAFRKMPKSFRWGTCAVVALLHDAFLCIAFYVIFDTTLNLEIDLMFITGILTVIGFSVHDTIVVFDRIRENMGKGIRNISFEDVVNRSLTETLTRCIITVMTVLLALIAVYLFVGDPIRNFLMVLLVGIVSGSYSSIFIASMLLVVWENRAAKKITEKVPLVPNSKSVPR